MVLHADAGHFYVHRSVQITLEGEQVLVGMRELLCNDV